MKRFFTTSFILLALVVGAAGAAPAAHADDIECTLNNGGTSCAVDGVSGICSGDENSGPYCRVTGTSDSTSFSDPAAEGTPKTYDAPPTTPEAGLNGIMAWIASLFALLAGVAMVTLNYAVYFTVVTMGTYVNNLSAVGVTWQIMRDIGNIVIIFGFLAIGISTILNTERLGYGKKMLPMLLVAAVFLNFSLFISEAVIDTGNLFATQFYTQINGGNLPTLATASSQGVSDKIMNQLGLTTIYGGVRTQSAALYKENPMFIGFMSIILFIILAFVLFSLAFILIARFVILLFLIIVSPIGFAGLAVPKLDGTAKLWWHNLFKQTITAPVLLMLLYIALAIITDANFLTSGGKPPEWLGLFGSDGATNIAGFATAILSFLIAMGLLLAVVIISKKMSVFGAAGASALAGKLSFGLTAAGMRFTAGVGLNAVARGVRNSKLGRVPVIGRAFLGALDRGAKASFDIRGVKAGGGLGVLSVDAGKAKEGGYRKIEEEAIKAREAHATSLGMNKDERDRIKADEDVVEHLKAVGEQIKRLNDTEMRNLQNRQAADPDMVASNTDVANKRTDLRTAEASGNVARINAANVALNNALLYNGQKRAEQNQEREALQEIHDKKINDNKDSIKEVETDVANTKKAPAMQYAQNILAGPGKYLYKNQKAAQNIIKNAGKSKDQLDVEHVLELAKKYAATTTPTGTPPPAPTPPAGGGTSSP
ncbi:MAG TPA: hypothetical protein VJI70_03565 [Candidatus Paceibacterota bacterium]